ncbi:MAG: tRNA (5-methylaminomethyl-2-thiouridine)(34)-methyltransferase MnmD [Rhodobacteraceae bacterium]|nr:tRNA (5-methylaminomethyl-2-thiouridine)(34)-methyltransferase MnmD [Paracoccaceae bacterium]MYF46007.1 tRNA (5-methylaminomethyl-2-thiouridine)(34)-methyltransferase MnmD [Paracoccaceae bacterium]
MGLSKEKAAPQYSDYLELYWNNDRQLRSARFQDIFFSSNGIEETRHVFIKGNDLPDNFKENFHIGELGFGTGLNLFVALQLWRERYPDSILQYTSFEIAPLPGKIMTEALEEFDAIGDICREFLSEWEKGKTKIEIPNLAFELIVGDVRKTIHAFNKKVDCWFLDGFSPNTNPEMWEEDLLQQVAERTKAGGTFATFSSASSVRENLIRGGFEIFRVPGFGKKKHMLKGMLPT